MDIGTQFVDESSYLRRGSSSLAKKIEAFLRYSLASRSSRFSLSSCLIRVCSALVTPGAFVRADLGLENPPAQGLPADIQLQSDGGTGGKNGVVLT